MPLVHSFFRKSAPRWFIIIGKTYQKISTQFQKHRLDCHMAFLSMLLIHGGPVHPVVWTLLAQVKYLKNTLCLWPRRQGLMLGDQNQGFWWILGVSRLVNFPILGDSKHDYQVYVYYCIMIIVIIALFYVYVYMHSINSSLIPSYSFTYSLMCWVSMT